MDEGEDEFANLPPIEIEMPQIEELQPANANMPDVNNQVVVPDDNGLPNAAHEIGLNGAANGAAANGAAANGAAANGIGHVLPNRPRILFCVCGSSNAQGVAEMVHFFNDAVEMKIVATRSALMLFNRAAIRNVPIYSDEDEGAFWAVERRVLHEELAGWAQVVLVLPATCNTLTKIALGISDNLVTTIVRSYNGRVLIVPDMSVAMFMKPATAQRIQELRNMGYFVLDPPEFPVQLQDNGPEVLVRGPMPSIIDVQDWLIQTLNGVQPAGGP